MFDETSTVFFFENTNVTKENTLALIRNTVSAYQTKRSSSRDHEISRENEVILYEHMIPIRNQFVRSNEHRLRSMNHDVLR